jgi:hypothetical protein
MLSPLPEYESHNGPNRDAVLLGLVAARTRLSWGTVPYVAALHGMAELHAGWWDKVQEDGPWPRLAEVYAPGAAISNARGSLLAIESENWTQRLLGEGSVSTLLSLLDDPAPVLDLLRSAPVTLIAPGEGREETDRYVYAGPAAYDLASFYASSRWLYGRTPLGMVETRNAYLRSLDSLLGSRVDECLFDITLDAARCWSFALGWSEYIAARPPALMARAHLFRAAVAEPALAALRRLQRI